MKNKITKKLISTFMALALVISLLPPLTLPATAATTDKLYFTEAVTIPAGDYTHYRVCQMDLDGSNLGQVYWSEEGDPQAIAADPEAGYVYYSAPATTTAKIFRVNLDGTGITTLMTGVYANDLAIDKTNGKLYFTEAQTVGLDDTTHYRVCRMNLDGTNFEEVCRYSDSNAIAIAVDPEAEYIYYSEPAVDTATIFRVNLEGTETTALMTGVYANDLAIDKANGKLYFTEAQTVDLDDSTHYRVCRMDLDGTDLEQVYWDEDNDPQAVAVDPGTGYVYYSAPATAKIFRVNLDGTITTLMTGVYANDLALPLQTAATPTVTTQAATDIAQTTATGNGNITSLGSPNPTQYGVVWGTSADPTVALSTKTEQGAASATGAFTSSITGLTAETTYHIRAYATNTSGTSYGDDVTFTTTATASTPFYYGNALHYADSNDSLSRAYLTEQLDNVSMETWVKADTFSKTGFIRVLYNGNSGNSGYGIYLYADESTNVVVPCIMVGGVATPGPTGFTLTPNAWYHLAAVRDNGTWKLYVNGQKLVISGADTVPNPINTSTNTFTVGNSSLGENFNGLIDEVRFWTVARTDQQILDNMYIKLEGNEAGLQAYYNFDQGGIAPGGDNTSITTVTDVAGGDQNLTLSGFALTGSTSNFVSSANIGSFGIENSSYSVGESDGYVTVRIVRSDGTEGAVKISCATADGTAAAGTNYTATNASVTFADGESSKDIQIPVINSTLSASKSFTFSITAPQGVTLGASSSANITITPSIAPAVTSISPTSGPAVGGTSVTITGSNFTGATAVKFGANAALFTVNSDAEITATAPAGAGMVSVTITTASGTSNAVQYTYAAPVVSSINPIGGSPAGGTSVTITGLNFTGATAVNFGTNAASFAVDSDTQITATAPSGTGAVNVTVTSASGTSNAVQYAYAAPVVSSINPIGGSPAGGTSVTITGLNFTGATAVNFGTNAASFAVDSDTQITATAPSGTGAVNVTVTSASGTSNAVQYAYAAPTVTSINPTGGPAVGGTSVTITGLNFTGATAVKFGNTNATSYTVDSDTQITATAPSGTGAVNVTVTSASGTSNAVQYAYAAPTVTSINPTNGPTLGGTSVTITGLNFTGATAVTIGGSAATGITVVNSTTITATTPEGTAGAKDVVVTTPSGTGTCSGLFTYENFPEMGIKSGPAQNVLITSGDATPSTVDFTNFGNISHAASTTLTYRIYNTGNADLNLTGTPRVTISGASEFTIAEYNQPASPVVPGNYVEFRIKFQPTAVGTRTATVSIANNDSDENPYTFTIQATGTNTAPTVSDLPSVITVTEDTSSNVDLSVAAFSDADGDALIVTLTASAGTFTANSGGSVTISGSGTGTLTLSGTLTNINTYLDTATNIKYTGEANASGYNAATIIVNANDATVNPAVGTVNIDITAVNDAPSITSGDSASFVENGTGTVYDADAADPDAGDTLTWSISGTDAGLFDINSGTGVLTFKTAPNFEDPADIGKDNIYDLTVTVTDNGTGNLTATKTLAIMVTNINDAPIISTADKISVTEGSTAAFTAAATDAEGSAVAWSITGGDDMAKFSIIPGSGVVTFAISPSFSAPTDADTNNSYVLEITASDGELTAAKTITVTVTQKHTSSTPTPTSAVVEVNGQTQNAGTSSTTTSDGQRVTTIIVDDTKLSGILEQQGNNATVTLPVSTASEVVVGEMNGQTIKNMEAKEATLEIKTETVTYTLPASQINIGAVSSQFGSQVELKDIKVSVKIAVPPEDTARIVEDTANRNNYQIVVKPVEFGITCTSGDKTVSVSKFNGYVERTVAIPDGVDPSKITTGIVLNADGTFSHVPTTIILIDGKYYAKINSLTNSTYSVIYNPVEFADIANHWAKDAINDMGSRLVVTGYENGNYNPNVRITRAEFAAIIVRAMGLQKGQTDSSFSDVTLTDWFNGYVDTATQYRLITGYDSTSYGPNDLITREQAMTTIARAMKLAGLSISLTDSEVSALLASYTDGANVSSYAKESSAACLKAGIVNGTSATTLSPKDNVTRAEVAVMVERLLQKSGLI